MVRTFEELRDRAAAFASSWALGPDGTDQLSIDDLPAAWALRIDAFNLVFPLLLRAAGQQTEFQSRGWIARLKRGGFDRAVRAGSLRVLSPRSSEWTLVDALFVCEQSTPSTLEPMLAAADAMPAGRWRAVVTDPRAWRAWMRHGHRPIASVLDWREQTRLLRDGRRLAEERWDAIASRPPSLVIDDIDLSEPALRALHPLIRRSLPWLLVEHRALHRSVSGAKPRWLIIASDQHRIGRLAVDVARTHGARTLVLQHGLPQYEIGYLPVVADAVATWGHASTEWFRERGTDPDRLVQLGNPRLDRLGSKALTDRARARASSIAGTGRPRLLLALGPNDARRNVAILDLAAEFVGKDSTAALVVKLHPADGEWMAIRERVRGLPPSVRRRVEIRRKEPLYQLLSWADLTLLHRSTVAIESLAAGTPVAIAAAGPAGSVADALPNDLELPEVATADDIGALTAEVLEDGGASYFEARRSAIERSTGPLDGSSAQRIAAFLTAG